MKIIISKKRLEVAVKNICRVINKKNALPILDDIRFDVSPQEKTVTLTGSDSEIFLHYKVELDAAEGDSTQFCVGAKWLKMALAELKDQPLTISLSQDGTAVIIQHQTGSTQLPAIDAAEYPLVKWNSETTCTWTLDSPMLKRVLDRSIFFMADDEMRPVMCGAYFCQAKNQLNIVASDGHVLIHNCEEITNQDGSFIMPKKAAKLLAKMITGTDEVKISFDERMVSVAHGSMEMDLRAIEGKYPNYLAVIPESTPYELTVDILSLLAAVRNVVNFTVENHRQVKLDIQHDHRLTVSGADWDQSVAADDTIDIEYPNGTPMQIGVKGDSLIKVLQLTTGRRAVIHFTDPSRAITIVTEEPIENEAVTMLMMPMLLND